MSTDANGSDNGVGIHHLEPQAIVSIRATVQIAEIGEAMSDRLPTLLGYLEQSGAKAAGPLFVRYHSFGETETDMETGISVTEAVAGEGRIVGGELPGGTAVITWHMGPHNLMGDAYGRISSFMEAQGREANGPAREVYHWIDPRGDSDPSTWSDPSIWRTELIQPVK